MKRLVLNGPEQAAGPYSFFSRGTELAFEMPDDSSKRYYLDERQTKEIKEMLFRALEEKVGERVGVQVFAAPAFVPVDASELSLTVENEWAEEFVIQQVQFEKLNAAEEWVPFPSKDNVLQTGNLSCDAYRDLPMESEFIRTYQDMAGR